MIDINSVLSDQKKAWGIAASLILCALAFFLLFKYDFGNFRKTRLAADENRYNAATLDSLGEYKKYLDEFKAYLAPSNGIDWLMGTITMISKGSGVTLSAVKPFETERSSGYGIVKVSVEGISSYKSFIRFIEALEDNEKYIFVDSISISPIEVRADWPAKKSPALLAESAPRDRSIGFNAIIAVVTREM